MPTEEQISCDMSTELKSRLPQKRLPNNLHEIMEALDGFLSKWSSMEQNGTGTSPALSLTVNVNVIAPIGGSPVHEGNHSGNAIVNFKA